MSQAHPLARTTPRIRAEIKDSSASVLAERCNISVATARKWKGRDDMWVVSCGRGALGEVEAGEPRDGEPACTGGGRCGPVPAQALIERELDGYSCFLRQNFGAFNNPLAQVKR